MISAIEGILVRVGTHSVYLRLQSEGGLPPLMDDIGDPAQPRDTASVGGLEYEVLVTGFALEQLRGRVGRPIRLSTTHYLESPNQGMMFLPRLAGFTSELEQGVFSILTSVKGIGFRKALRVMALEPHRIADAIAQGDTRLLSSLPELGKKSAENVIAAGSEKASELIGTLPGRPRSGGDGSPTASGHVQPAGGSSSAAEGELVRDAVEALVALGESRLDAERWVRHAAAQQPPAGQVGELLQRVFALRQPQ
ncbi:MAG: hypothetical protein JJU36_02690 [Phycisphaeraceae bacterium]|nr:hypothetical protein [Phycisphaeraceae bacterium]